MSSGKSSRPASSRPPRRAISKGWRRCWPTTSCSTPTAAARRPPSHARSTVARTLTAGLRALTLLGGFSSRREEVNGQPGALFIDREGRLVAVMTLDVAEGQIQGVSSIANPDKLRHLGPLADLGALRRERN